MSQSFFHSFIIIVALTTIGASSASAQASQEYWRAQLKQCQTGDAQACEHFARGADDRSVNNDVWKFAIPGAVEMLHPLCRSHNDYGRTSYCHAEANIQAYIDSKSEKNIKAAAEDARTNASACLKSKTIPQKVQTGLITPLGASYETVYDVDATNICNYPITVKVTTSGLWVEKITLSPHETFSGVNVSVDNPRRENQ